MAKYLIDENIENNTDNTFDIKINKEFLNNILSLNSENNIEKLIDIYNQSLCNDFIKSDYKYVLDGNAFTIENV